MEPEQIRQAVLEENILDRATWHSRRTVWEHIFRRYMSGRAPQHVATLAHMVDQCPTEAAANLVLFYEYCQADALLYDITADCTYSLYQNARTAIESLTAIDVPGIAQRAVAAADRQRTAYVGRIAVAAGRRILRWPAGAGRHPHAWFVAVSLLPHCPSLLDYDRAHAAVEPGRDGNRIRGVGGARKLAAGSGCTSIRENSIDVGLVHR